MSKIPCKKCKSCGVYHDLSNDICDECGTDLSNIPALLIETEEIPGEKYGEIDESITVFVQKCSACGTLNFTSDKNSPIKVCYNCHKTRIASIKPEEYLSGTEVDKSELTEHIGIDDIVLDQQIHNGNANAFLPKNDDDDDDEIDDNESSQWQSILGNIKGSVGFTDVSAFDVARESSSAKMDTEDNSNDDDDDEATDWSDILGGQSTPKKAIIDNQNISHITLTAIRYGQLSFTLKADAGEQYLLGRSANQREFLSKDLRVGNEHCYLLFRNGCWYVKDNHSSNGTAVNSKDIGLNGESKLNDGDELKLGHHSDSMAFRVIIR